MTQKYQEIKALNKTSFRYLDEKGMEIIRVNFNNGAPEIVEQRFLQLKARYY